MEMDGIRNKITELENQVAELDNRTGLSPEETAKLEKLKKELATERETLKVQEAEAEQKAKENSEHLAAATVTAATRVVEKIVNDQKPAIPNVSRTPLDENKPHLNKEDLDNVVANMAATAVNTQVPPDLKLAGKTAVILAEQQDKLAEQVRTFSSAKVSYDNSKKKPRNAKKEMESTHELESTATRAPAERDSRS